MATSPAMNSVHTQQRITDRGKVVLVLGTALLVVLVMYVSTSLMFVYHAPQQQLEVLKIGLIVSINFGQLLAIRLLRARATITLVVTVTIIETYGLYLLGPFH